MEGRGKRECGKMERNKLFEVTPRSYIENFQQSIVPKWGTLVTSVLPDEPFEIVPNSLGTAACRAA